jgi:hypothetical protein
MESIPCCSEDVARPRSPERKARANEFKRLFEAFGFTGHALQKLAQERRDKCWIRDHLPGHVAQTAATRAFNAILQYAFGKRGRPKFRPGDRYNSFESKEARSTIIWRDGAVRIAGWVIPAILDPASAWQSEALKAKTKYCRIIRRDIRGRERWYVQLVQEGLTPLRRETKRGVVGPQALARKRRERERCLAAERKRSHGELANRILGNGTTVKTEKLSYKAWQRYGKSTKVRSPAAFVNVVRNKIRAARGELIEFGKRNTCLSQFCHLRGTYTKKPLSQRYHQLPDGTRVGRDVYSAFLARFVLDNRLDAIQAAKAWTGAEAFLRVASNGFEPASGKGFAFPHVTLGVRAGRSKKYRANHREAGDDVGLAVLPVFVRSDWGQQAIRSRSGASAVVEPSDRPVHSISWDVGENVTRRLTASPSATSTIQWSPSAPSPPS